MEKVVVQSFFFSSGFGKMLYGGRRCEFSLSECLSPSWCQMCRPVPSFLPYVTMAAFFASTQLKWDSLASLPPTSLNVASLFSLSSVCKRISFICFLVSIFCKCYVSVLNLRIFLFLLQIVFLSLSSPPKRIGSDVILWTSMSADSQSC